MKKSWLCFLVSALPFAAIAAPATIFGLDYTSSPPNQNAVRVNSSGQISTTLLAGEDQTNNVIRTEGQFSYKNIPHADTQVKASAGFIHTVTCTSQDAAATAGTIAILDSTAAGAGVTILALNIVAQYYAPFTLTLDTVTTTGIYMDYTTTGDVDCVVSYR